MKAAVIGYEKSGRSASKLLKKLGYKVTVIIDERKLDKTKIGRLVESLPLIVTSPGVPPDCELMLEAKKQNKTVIGELELGFQNMQGSLVAITGTNGKTTVTSLIGHLLSDHNPFVVGNIGTPITSICKKTTFESLVIAEVSSFQLCTTKTFRPHISAFLNFTPDHLNYHKTMQNYFDAKLNIFKNQTEKDFAILNADDPVVSQIIPPKSKVFYFSTKKRVNGCFASGSSIYFRDTSKTIPGFNRAVKVADIADIHLLGEHNLSNALCAICAAILVGEPLENIKKNLKTFKPVSHRLEYVTDIDGISFINDSKATNTLSTVCAIASMDRPTTLILGGSDKGLGFDEIFNSPSSLITSYVLMGETQNKLLETAKKWGKDNVFLADNLSSAVELAYNITQPGGNVLFSPACASFDMFTNYEQRGKCFCGIVRGLKKSENNRIKNNKKV